MLKLRPDTPQYYIAGASGVRLDKVIVNGQKAVL